VAFELAAVGSDGAHPHHAPAAHASGADDAVVTSIGTAPDGHPPEIARMAAVGRPPAGCAGIHAVVETGRQAALAPARPGAPARDVDRAARDVIAGAGYGEDSVHRAGHCLGPEVHGRPYPTATSPTVPEGGVVFGRT
jgi:Xaa-Pro aminopeptidase